MSAAIKKIDIQALVRIIITTFVFGLICHGFCYFNANFSHDCLTVLYSSDSVFEVLLSGGRFIRPLWTLVKGRITLPWLNGFLFLLFLGAAIYLIVETLEIKNKLLRALSCGILVTNYSISLLHASFIHDVDSYALSLLFAMFGLWLLLNCQTKWKYASIVFFTVSLGLYQAYIQVIIFILIVCAIKRALGGYKPKKTYSLFLQIFFLYADL